MAYKKINKINIEIKDTYSLPYILSELKIKSDYYIDFLIKKQKQKDNITILFGFLFGFSFFHFFAMAGQNFFISFFFSALPCSIILYFYYETFKRLEVSLFIKYKQEISETLKALEINIEHNIKNSEPFIISTIDKFTNINQDTEQKYIIHDQDIIYNIRQIYLKAKTKSTSHHS